jgi:hypothetical protein
MTGRVRYSLYGIEPFNCIDISYAHHGSSGGTDGQSNGGCICSRYDIDVSVRVAGNAQTSTLKAGRGPDGVFRAD